MNFIITILFFIGLIIFVFISLLGIVFISRNREKYGTLFVIFLNILILFFIGLVYPITFFLAHSLFFSQITNQILIEISIMVEIITVGFFMIGYGSFWESRKYQIYFFIFIATLGGLTIGLLIQFNSCDIIINGMKFYFTFNTSFSISFILYQSIGIGYLLFVAYKVYTISNFPSLSKGLLMYTFLLSIPILTLPFSYHLNNEPLKFVHFFSLLFVITMKCIILWKKPYADNILTDKIYYINIYHKSGVLLYSYKFEHLKKTDIASEVWGNILIGINHILSEFIDTKGQINLLRTRNADIMVNYNDKFSFAILTIANKKSKYLEKLIKTLEEKIIHEYRRELKEIKDINKIINVSEFLKVNELIEDIFDIYL